MTAVVGVRCTDGVVLGTDSSATFTAAPRTLTIEQPTKKLFVVRDSVLVAGTGAVGLGQRFTRQVDDAWSKKDFLGIDPMAICRKLCIRGLKDFQETGAPNNAYGALVAFPCAKKPHLCEFDVNGFQPELKDEAIWYASLGSAQSITDPFLGFIRDVFWPHGPPSLHGGVFAAAWTLQQAIDLNTGGVKGPMQVGILEADGPGKARLIEDEELQEHKQAIGGAKEALREYAEGLSGTTSDEVAEVPEPES